MFYAFVFQCTKTSVNSQFFFFVIQTVCDVPFSLALFSMYNKQTTKYKKWKINKNVMGQWSTRKIYTWTLCMYILYGIYIHVMLYIYTISIFIYMYIYILHNDTLIISSYNSCGLQWWLASPRDWTTYSKSCVITGIQRNCCGKTEKWDRRKQEPEILISFSVPDPKETVPWSRGHGHPIIRYS